MIVDFTIENFRSIRDEQTFSLYAETPGKHLTENICYQGKDKIGVLKSAGLYGANASGKSNVLLAFAALRYLICESGSLKEGEALFYEPYLLAKDTQSAPTRFEIEFFVSKELVEEALCAKRDKTSPEGDIFWVVYDRKSEQKYDKVLHAAAYDKADKNKIKIALSNVCFEVWILLHFQDIVAPYNSYDDLRKQSALRDQCKARGIADYDKGDKNIFNIIEVNIDEARERTKRMNENTKKSANRD